MNGEPMTETLTEALARISRRGYARRFALDGDRLLCASCEVAIEQDDLVVDEVIRTCDHLGEPDGSLFVLHCLSCGVAGAWLVDRSDPAETSVASQLQRRSDASASDKRETA